MKNRIKNFLGGWVGIVILFALFVFVIKMIGSSSSTESNLSSDGGHEPCQINGHPLWTDC